jgi:CubicO group peptidase (beta-lactamase class C family)
VEALSGMPFSDYVKTFIFEPLGMTDTDFYVPANKAARLASNYGRGVDKSLHLLDPSESSIYLHKPLFESGGGGLVSTAQDYLRFCQMLVQNGVLNEERVISRRTLALMRQNHLGKGRDLTQLAIGSFSETAYEGIGFGLGFAVNTDEVASGQIGRDDYYWGGAASTIFSVDPHEDLIIIFLTQLMPSSTFNFRGQLKSIVYGAIDD